MGCVADPARTGPVKERPNGSRQPLCEAGKTHDAGAFDRSLAWSRLAATMKAAIGELCRRFSGQVHTAFAHRFWLATRETCAARRIAELDRLVRERAGELHFAWRRARDEVKTRREAEASRLRGAGQDATRKCVPLRSRSGPSGSAGSDH